MLFKGRIKILQKHYNRNSVTRSSNGAQNIICVANVSKCIGNNEIHKYCWCSRQPNTTLCIEETHLKCDVRASFYYQLLTNVFYTQVWLHHLIQTQLHTSNMFCLFENCIHFITLNFVLDLGHSLALNKILIVALWLVLSTYLSFIK